MRRGLALVVLQRSDKFGHGHPQGQCLICERLYTEVCAAFPSQAYRNAAEIVVKTIEEATMRAKRVAILMLVALSMVACGHELPTTPTPTPTPYPTATPTPRYSNSPEGAARMLLDSWQEFDADLYLDAIVPEERRQTNIFEGNVGFHALASWAKVSVSADRPRLKFCDLRFETVPESTERAYVVVTGFMRELNIAKEYGFTARIVTVQQNGAWLCKPSETVTNIPPLNLSAAAGEVGKTAEEILGIILTPLARVPVGGNLAPTATTTPDFRATALREITSVSSFRVDIIDYSNGVETRSIYWQQNDDWRWLLPRGEFIARGAELCWREQDAPWNCESSSWPSRFRRLPMLALSLQDFSSQGPGDWLTFAPHSAETVLRTIEGVSALCFSNTSARDREECCFNLQDYRPTECTYALDGVAVIARYADWNVPAHWEFPVK
jgi:hypothetical protein